MERKQKLILLIIGLSLVLVCAGLSFAFFTSITNNESASTIYAKGGTMNIRYANGSGNITMENIYPREESWVNKTFTVTGNNSTELDMEYRLYLVTTSNGFNAGDLTYSISGTSTNQADKLVEKANQPLAKAGELLLGKGIFKSKTATHSYNLRIFYKETNEEQNNGQGKLFTGYVRIDNGSNLAYDTLVTQRLGNNNYGENGDQPAFNGPITRSEVKTITFTNSSEVPANAISSWDAGEKQDGTILAYLLNKDENGLYDLYIGHDGKIVLGQNASYLFSGYNKTTTLDVSNIDTSNVTNMSYMFVGNKATSIKGLDKFDTSNVTDMRGMFASCDANSIYLNNFNTSKVTSMNRMFDKSKVTKLDLSSFDTSNVTDMNGMFANTTATEIKGLEYFNTSKVTDMRSMFEGVLVESLNLTGFDTSSVKNMASMFSNAKAKTIDTSNFNTSIVVNMHRMFYYTSNIDKINLSSFDTSNVQIMSSMFMGSSVTIIEGLNGLNTSRVTSMDSMFRMSKLKTLDLSSFNTHNVTTMGQMFDWAEAETIIGLENFDTSNVTNMGQMFESCNTKNLNLTSFVTTKVTNMGRMFDGNKAETIDLSSFDVSNISIDKMDNMFRNCKSKTIYVKDQTSLDKFNSSSNKPSALTFTVKS